MYNFRYYKDQMDKTISPDVLERRSGVERRKAHARGFKYINTVGWICRREQVRRKDDLKDFYRP